jgi:hypothetical protein
LIYIWRSLANKSKGSKTKQIKWASAARTASDITPSHRSHSQLLEP